MSDTQEAVATPAAVATTTCRECTSPPADGHTRCQRHLDLHSKRTRQKRSRERKQAFPKEQRRRLVELITNGVPLPQACEKVGVAMPRVHALAQIEARWAEQLDEALMAGRDPDIAHGTTYSYKQLRCRCPECRRAKSIERGPRRRPAEAAEGRDPKASLWSGIKPAEQGEQLPRQARAARGEQRSAAREASTTRSAPKPTPAEEDRAHRVAAARRKLGQLLPRLEAGATVKEALSGLGLNPNYLANLRKLVPEADRKIREAYQAGAAVRAARRAATQAPPGAGDREVEQRAAQLVVAAVAAGKRLDEACVAGGATAGWVVARYRRHDAFRQALTAAAALHPGLDLHRWLEANDWGGPVPTPRPPS